MKFAEKLFTHANSYRLESCQFYCVLAATLLKLIGYCLSSKQSLDDCQYISSLWNLIWQHAFVSFQYIIIELTWHYYGYYTFQSILTPSITSWVSVRVQFCAVYYIMQCNSTREIFNIIPMHMIGLFYLSLQCTTELEWDTFIPHYIWHNPLLHVYHFQSATDHA